MDIGGNACIRRSLKNGRPLANSPVTGTNLNSLRLWNKDFVRGAGRALSAKALKSGKRNVRLATRLHTISQLFMPNWETNIRLSSGSTPLIRSTIGYSGI